MRVGNGRNDAIEHIVQTTDAVDMHEAAVIAIKIDDRRG